jgi:DNA-binding MarR family transcriptional regulator
MLSEMGSASKEKIFEDMQTFVDAQSLDQIITGFVERGWIEQSGGSEFGKVAFQLTEEGRRKHGVILATQKEVRRRAMQDISEEEYMTAIRVLQKIVSNLEGNGRLADRQDSGAA